MKYERLTKKGGLNFADPNLSLVDEWGYSHIYKRLAEYEDDEESGKIVRLPCKVGDTIYWISSNNRDIIEVVVNRITFAGHDRTILYVEEKGLGEYSIMFVDDIFLTREEAEKRLKELQE